MDGGRGQEGGWLHAHAPATQPTPIHATQFKRAPKTMTCAQAGTARMTRRATWTVGRWPAASRTEFSQFVVSSGCARIWAAVGTFESARAHAPPPRLCRFILILFACEGTPHLRFSTVKTSGILCVIVFDTNRLQLLPSPAAAARRAFASKPWRARVLTRPLHSLARSLARSHARSLPFRAAAATAAAAAPPGRREHHIPPANPP